MTTGGQKGTNYSKLIRVNSANRTSGESNSFTIDLGNAAQQITRVSLTSAQFYNVFYNIYNTPIHSNSKIEWIVFGNLATSVLQLDPGYYSADDLIDIIVAAMASDPDNPVNLTTSFNSFTSKYTFTSDENLLILKATYADGRHVDYHPFEMIGFYPTVQGLFNSFDDGVPRIADSIPSMNPFTMAYITSSALSPLNSIDEGGLSSNILLPINITASWGSLNVFECKVDSLCEVTYSRPRNLSKIDIQLVDHELVPLDLQQTPLNLELRVWTNFSY